MLLIIGPSRAAEDYIRDTRLNRNNCRIIAAPYQLRGLDRGLPAILVGWSYWTHETRHQFLTLIKEREVVVLEDSYA